MQYRAGKKHFCPYCDKVQQSIAAFSKHLQFHSVDYQHKCDKCKYGFKTEEMLHDHIQVYHTVRDHTCKWCSLVVRDIQMEYAKHVGKCRLKNAVVKPTN